jgi:sugar phosphate isomerase/epimerase
VNLLSEMSFEQTQEYLERDDHVFLPIAAAEQHGQHLGLSTNSMGVHLKISLSTACLYVYPLRWIFALAKRAGFDGVELVISPEVEMRGGAYARKLSEEYGLEIFTVHPPMFQYRGWDKSLMSIAPYLSRALRVTQDVEASLLVIHMPKAHDAQTGIGRAFIQEVVGTREKMNGAGPHLALENRPHFRARDAQYILTQPHDLRAFADAHDFPMTLDTAHLGTWDLDLLDAFDFFRGRLANVHLSDLRDVSSHIERTPALHSYVKQHQLPGAGKLPLRDFLRLLTQEGYDGPVTFELSPTALQIWNPRAVERKLKEAIAFVRQATSRKTLDLRA